MFISSCNNEIGLLRPEEQMEIEIAKFETYFAERGISPQFHNRGMFIHVIEEGSGRIPTAGNTLVVNYTGYFLNGDVFDSSVGRGPFQFQFKRGRVIQGWDIGFEFLKETGKATFFITSELAYGRSGQGSIPPNTPLIFDVELLEVRP
jgi:FKBP-type peptidyl-prolyl cis-trans isomerase